MALVAMLSDLCAALNLVDRTRLLDMFKVFESGCYAELDEAKEEGWKAHHIQW